MANIRTNLKQLRLSKEMTQEDVAQRIGLTRQAISSYESGRTQPSVDLLMRFAEIYEVELEEILYGQKKEVKERKRLKIAVIVITAIWLALQISSFGVIIGREILYPWETLSGEEYNTEAVDKFFAYTEVSEKLAKSATQVMSIGCYIMCVLDWTLEKPINIKKKMLYIGCVIMVSTLLFIGVERLFFTEYRENWSSIFSVLLYHTELLNILSILGVNLIGLGIKRISKRKKNV